MWPVLSDLYTQQWRYLRGNQPRCVSDQKDADNAILETHDVKIGLGAPGKNGWADLVLTVTSTLDGGRADRKPLRVRVPYDGRTYRLDVFNIAYERWSK